MIFNSENRIVEDTPPIRRIYVGIALIFLTFFMQNSKALYIFNKSSFQNLYAEQKSRYETVSEYYQVVILSAGRMLFFRSRRSVLYSPFSKDRSYNKRYSVAAGTSAPCGERDLLRLMYRLSLSRKTVGFAMIRSDRNRKKLPQTRQLLSSIIYSIE